MDIDELFEFEECDKGYILKDYLLKDDPSVTEVEIPSEYRGKPVTDIGKDAFSESKHLQGVKIAEGIGEIGIKAFYSCENLKTVMLPDSLTAIRRSAFNRCTNLEEIAFPEGLKQIGAEAFFICRLKSIELPLGLEELGKGAFSGCCMKTVVIPEKIKTVSDRLFVNCFELESIELPDSLKEIGEFAFYNCSLRTIRLPSGLEKIGLRAFSHCENLEKVDFGKGAPFLDYDIFELCPKLSAENVIQGLACSVNVSKPFHKDDLSEWDSGQWDDLLREDVFALALKNNSFAFFNKEKLLKKILKKKRFSLFPLMENYGWKFSKELIYSLISKLNEQSDVGYRAWLLNYKNRHFEFLGEDYTHKNSDFNDEDFDDDFEHDDM